MAFKVKKVEGVKRVEVYFLDPHCETGWSGCDLSLEDSCCFVMGIEQERTDEHYIVAQAGGTKDTMKEELLNRLLIPWDHVIQIYNVNVGRVIYKKKPTKKK